MQLWPRGISTQPKLSHNTENESNSYRFFHAGKVCQLFNPAYYQHLLTSPNCPNTPGVWLHQRATGGSLLDRDSEMHLLPFLEWEDKAVRGGKHWKKREKLAKPNLALWTALLDNPIMSKGLQEIFKALNRPAPSTTGLQHNVNKVGPMTVQMVQEDLKRESGLTVRTSWRVAVMIKISLMTQTLHPCYKNPGYLM